MESDQLTPYDQFCLLRTADKRLENAKKFFEKEENKEYFELLKLINSGESEISLRTIDTFFLTNVPEGYRNKIVTKLGGKKYFDPFKRGKLITYRDMKTTVGQLNFFSWFFGSTFDN